MIVTGLNLAQDRKFNEMAWLAWHTASLHRAKKVPRLSRLIKTSKRERVQQTIEEQMKIMSDWSSKMEKRAKLLRDHTHG